MSLTLLLFIVIQCFSVTCVVHACQRNHIGDNWNDNEVEVELFAFFYYIKL